MQADANFCCQQEYKRYTENGIVFHYFSFSPSIDEEKSNLLPAFSDRKEYVITWRIPICNFTGVWYPDTGLDRAIRDIRFNTMQSRFAPVMCYFNSTGENQYTFSVSEVKQCVRIQALVSEETGFMEFRLGIDADGAEAYQLQIREDRRQLPYYMALKEVGKWWNSHFMEIPDIAEDPMYSTWYVFHQNLSAQAVEEECRRAVRLGMKTVITDDGWQTNDNHRGYAYCGDWQLQESRFPDFSAHVENIHAMGMKYLVWFSVPFLGRKSVSWPLYQDKLLAFEEDLGAGVLDPRYPEVRDYLVNTFKNFVKTYHLDGLKLDFIDQFYLRTDSPACGKGMDIPDVQDAVDCMMIRIRRELLELNPQIMIEFRQPYAGPKMLDYGNMFRAADCPCSELTNRVRTIDLRLMAGKAAVHADMLMWHPDETDEEVSRKIIGVIFSVVQFSVRLENISIGKESVLKHWIKFMKTHRDLLLHSNLIPEEPQHLYPIVTAENESQAVIAAYAAGRVLTVKDEWKQVFILNGVEVEYLYFRVEVPGRYSLRTVDCHGDAEMLEYRVFRAGELAEYAVPIGGLLEIKAA